MSFLGSCAPSILKTDGTEQASRLRPFKPQKLSLSMLSTGVHKTAMMWMRETRRENLTFALNGNISNGKPGKHSETDKSFSEMLLFQGPLPTPARL